MTDDVFVAITHKSGVISHLFTSPNVAILGPRLTVLGSKGAYVKHGIDPQEEALLAGGTPGTPGLGRGARVELGQGRRRRRRAPAAQRAWQLPRSSTRASPTPSATAPQPPVTTEQGIAMMELLDAARLSAREERVVELGT